MGPVQQDGHGTISWYYFRVRHLSVRRQEKKTNWTVVEWTDVQEVGSMERSLRRRRTTTNQSQDSVCFYVQAFGNNEGSLVVLMDGPTGPAPPGVAVTTLRVELFSEGLEMRKKACERFLGDSGK